MTGIVPSPMNKADDKLVVLEGSAAAPSAATTANTTTTTTTTKRSNLVESRPAAAPAPVRRAPERTVEDRRPARTVVGNTSSGPGEGAVGGGATPGRNVAAVCYNCGTVTSVRVVREQGQAGLIGPIAGGALGGLAGSQIGGGSGKTIATIAGAAGGAMVGTEVERRQKSTTSYVVGVRLNDGTTQSFNFTSAPGFNEGDRVRVVDGRLVRDS
jgi:outer membrane lipoprotein SlyB